jgi:hypothetical protein
LNILLLLAVVVELINTPAVPVPVVLEPEQII